MTQNQGIRTQDHRVAKDECRTAGQGPEVLSFLCAHFAVNVLFGHGSTDRPPNELWIGQPLRISWEWSRRPESTLTDGRPCRHHRVCVSYVTCSVKNSEQCAIVLHQQLIRQIVAVQAMVPRYSIQQSVYTSPIFTLIAGSSPAVGIAIESIESIDQ